MAHDRRTRRVCLAQLAFLQVVFVEAQHLTLSDNLQEPEGRGFCVDLAGVTIPRLQDVIVQSCAVPARHGAPTRMNGFWQDFHYDNGSVAARLNFNASAKLLETYCWQARAAEPHGHLDAAPCNASEALQRFSWTPTGMLALRRWPSLCVAASQQMEDGSCSSPTKVRSLSLETCNSVPWARRTWSYEQISMASPGSVRPLSKDSPGAGIHMMSRNETEPILADRPGNESASPDISSLFSARAVMWKGLELVFIAFCFCVCGALMFIRQMIAPKAGVPPPALPEENSSYIELDSEMEGLS